MKKTIVVIVLCFLFTACSREKSFFKTVQVGDADQVAEMLAEIKDVNILNEDGWNMLMVAAASNDDPNVIEKLVEAGIDVNGQTKTGITPFLIAAMNNHNVGVLQKLAELGADVNFPTDDGVTPIMAASIGNTKDVIQALINMGADLRAEDFEGTNSLMIAAAENQDPSVLKTILDAKVINVDAQNEEGLTALMIAVITNHAPEKVQALLDLGADINIKDEYDLTAYDYASKNEDIKGTDAHQRLYVGR